MSRTEIRPTIPADLADLADALIQVHSADGYPVEGVTDPQAWLHLPDALGQWTALLDGDPVGHVGMTLPAPGDAAPSLLAERESASLASIAVLVRLFVAPAARGQSLARQLVATVEEEAQSPGLRLTLDVMVKDRMAIALYERQGWITLGRFDHMHDNDLRTLAVAMMAPDTSP